MELHTKERAKDLGQLGQCVFGIFKLFRKHFLCVRVFSGRLGCLCCHRISCTVQPFCLLPSKRGHRTWYTRCTKEGETSSSFHRRGTSGNYPKVCQANSGHIICCPMCAGEKKTRLLRACIEYSAACSYPLEESCIAGFRECLLVSDILLDIPSL